MCSHGSYLSGDIWRVPHLAWGTVLRARWGDRPTAGGSGEAGPSAVSCG
ncbi:hypothetical protein T261_6981 [Streptomyces lydicus]|nr:hypothetical protein T261_6981 [Streptomyces lydicus]